MAGTLLYAAGTGVLTFTPDAPLLDRLAYELVVSDGPRTPSGTRCRRFTCRSSRRRTGASVTGLAASAAPGRDPDVDPAGDVRLLRHDRVVRRRRRRPSWGTGTLAVSGYLDDATISGLDATKDYSFSIFTERTIGAMGLATTTVHGSSDLVTVTPSPSVYVKPVTITATLRDAGTLAPEPNRSAAIYWRRTGTTAWTLIKVTQTDANGQVSAL